MENTIDIDAIRAEAATAERQRIRDILALNEAKDRSVAADNVAMNTDMSVESAKAFLAGMPVEAKSEPVDPWENSPLITRNAPGGLVAFNEKGEQIHSCIRFDAPRDPSATQSQRHEAMWKRAREQYRGDD
jgi:hypothetical protein